MEQGGEEGGGQGGVRRHQVTLQLFASHTREDGTQGHAPWDEGC